MTNNEFLIFGIALWTGLMIGCAVAYSAGFVRGYLQASKKLHRHYASRRGFDRPSPRPSAVGHVKIKEANYRSAESFQSDK